MHLSGGAKAVTTSPDPGNLVSELAWPPGCGLVIAGWSPYPMTNCRLLWRFALCHRTPAAGLVLGQAPVLIGAVMAVVDVELSTVVRGVPRIVQAQAV